MAAKKKHAPSVLLTDEENSMVREMLGQKKYVSNHEFLNHEFLNHESWVFDHESKYLEPVSFIR